MDWHRLIFTDVFWREAKTSLRFGNDAECNAQHDVDTIATQTCLYSNRAGCLADCGLKMTVGHPKTSRHGCLLAFDAYLKGTRCAWRRTRKLWLYFFLTFRASIE
jgi:hypothetical protein